MLVGAWLLAQPEPPGAGPAQRCSVGRRCKRLDLETSFSPKGGAATHLSQMVQSLLLAQSGDLALVLHGLAFLCHGRDELSPPGHAHLHWHCCVLSHLPLVADPPWSVAPECGHHRLCLAPPSVPWPDFCGKENHRVMVCLLFPNSHGWTSSR